MISALPLDRQLEAADYSISESRAAAPAQGESRGGGIWRLFQENRCIGAACCCRCCCFGGRRSMWIGQVHHEQ